MKSIPSLTTPKCSNDTQVQKLDLVLEELICAGVKTYRAILPVLNEILLCKHASASAQLQMLQYKFCIHSFDYNPKLLQFWTPQCAVDYKLHCVALWFSLIIPNIIVS